MWSQFRLRVQKKDIVAYGRQFSWRLKRNIFYSTKIHAQIQTFLSNLSYTKFPKITRNLPKYLKYEFSVKNKLFRFWVNAYLFFHILTNAGIIAAGILNSSMNQLSTKKNEGKTILLHFIDNHILVTLFDTVNPYRINVLRIIY